MCRAWSGLQVHGPMGELLDVARGRVEQLVGEIGQCSGGGQFIADLRDLPVPRAAVRFTLTAQRGPDVAVQNGSGVGTALVLVFADGDLDRPGSCVNHDSTSSG